MGSAADWCGFSNEMYGVRSSDYDSAQDIGKECKGSKSSKREEIKMFLNKNNLGVIEFQKRP